MINLKKAAIAQKTFRGFTLHSALSLTLLVALVRAQTPNIGAPVWTQIETSGQEVEYMLYSGAGVIEDVSSAAPWLGLGNNIYSSNRPPIAYNFSDLSYSSNTAVARGVCPAQTATIPNNLSNFNEGNWNPAYSGNSYASWQAVYYDPLQFPNPGYLTNASPSEFNESFLMSGAKGFTLLGSFTGNSTGTSSSNAYEVAYVTDEPCVGGDNEYGFFYDVAQANGANFGTLYFYYSALTNCGGGIACYGSSNFGSGPVLYQSTSPLTTITDLQSNLEGSMAFFFAAYLVPDSSGSPSQDYKFRVQVVDPDTVDLATCKINGGSLGSCTVDVPISSEYVWQHFADQIYGESDVNLITGIAVNGNPTNITSTSGLSVDGVWVGK